MNVLTHEQHEALLQKNLKECLSWTIPICITIGIAIGGIVASLSYQSILQDTCQQIEALKAR